MKYSDYFGISLECKVSNAIMFGSCLIWCINENNVSFLSLYLVVTITPGYHLNNKKSFFSVVF